jgi:hypothetical protein
MKKFGFATGAARAATFATGAARAATFTTGAARGAARAATFTTGAARAATFTSVVAGGLTAAILGLAAPAGAAPTGPGNAKDTIHQLQTDGYHVIVNRVGSTPLDQATVVAVRPGQTYSRTDSGIPGDNFGTTIVGKTIYVDFK